MQSEDKLTAALKRADRQVTATAVRSVISSLNEALRRLQFMEDEVSDSAEFSLLEAATGGLMDVRDGLSKLETSLTS